MPRWTFDKCDNENKCICLKPFAIRIKQLVYPGNDVEDIDDKWIYVFDENDLAVKVHAMSPDKWACYYKTSSKESEGTVDLASGSQYFICLSPIELTEEAIKSLKNDCNAFDPLAKVEVYADTEEVAIPDPIEWSLGISTHELVPSAEEYLMYVFDEDNAAKVSIATILKSIKEKDKDNDLGLNNELSEGQPNKFLDDHIKAEKTKKDDVKIAADNLVARKETIEYEAIEKSCMQKDEDKELMLTVNAVVNKYLNITEIGQLHAARLVGDDDGFIRKCTSPTSGFKKFSDIFKMGRRGQLLGFSVLTDFLPSMAGYWRSIDISTDEVVKRTLEFFESENLTDLGTNKAMLNNLRSNQNAFHGIASKVDLKAAQSDYIYYVENKDLVETFWDMKSVQQKRAVKWDKFYSKYKTRIANFKLSFGTVVELINAALMLERAYKEKSNLDKYMLVTGAGLKMGNQIYRLYAELVKKALSKKAMSGLYLASGIAAMIDAYFYEKDAYKAKKAGQNSAVVAGYRAAAVGSVFLAMGSITVMIKIYFASSYGAALLGSEIVAAELAVAIGAIGSFICILGGVIILVGIAVVAIFSDNEYEIFARYCFLRSEISIKKIRPAWTPEVLLPTSDSKMELVCLLDLLSNFVVSGEVEVSPSRDSVNWYLVIEPNYLMPDSIFEIYYKTILIDRKSNREFVVDFLLHVDPKNEKVTKVFCDTPLDYQYTFYYSKNDSSSNEYLSAIKIHVGQRRFPDRMIPDRIKQMPHGTAIVRLKKSNASPVKTRNEFIPFNRFYNEQLAVQATLKDQSRILSISEDNQVVWMNAYAERLRRRYGKYTLNDKTPIEE